MDNSLDAIPSLMEEFDRIDQEKKARRAELRRKNAANKANGISVKCGVKPLSKEERLKFLKNTFVLPKLPLDER